MDTHAQTRIIQTDTPPKVFFLISKKVPPLEEAHPND